MMWRYRPWDHAQAEQAFLSHMRVATAPCWIIEDQKGFGKCHAWPFRLRSLIPGARGPLVLLLMPQDRPGDAEMSGGGHPDSRVVPVEPQYKGQTEQDTTVEQVRGPEPLLTLNSLRLAGGASAQSLTDELNPERFKRLAQDAGRALASSINVFLINQRLEAYPSTHTVALQDAPAQSVSDEGDNP